MTLSLFRVCSTKAITSSAWLMSRSVRSLEWWNSRSTVPAPFRVPGQGIAAIARNGVLATRPV